MQLIILAEAFKTEWLLIYIPGRNSIRMHCCNVDWLLLWLYQYPEKKKIYFHVHYGSFGDKNFELLSILK